VGRKPIPVGDRLHFIMRLLAVASGTTVAELTERFVRRGIRRALEDEPTLTQVVSDQVPHARELIEGLEEAQQHVSIT
jgi:hypothetical protein